MVCFLVHPGYRRQGTSQRLLDRIVTDDRGLGYEYIEAYPRPGNLSAEMLYHGPQELYVRNGFQVIRKCGGNTWCDSPPLV